MSGQDTFPTPPGALSSHDRRLCELISQAVEQAIDKRIESFSQRYQDTTGQELDADALRGVFLWLNLGVEMHRSMASIRQNAAKFCIGGICTLIRTLVRNLAIIAIATVLAYATGAMQWVSKALHGVISWPK